MRWPVREDKSLGAAISYNEIDDDVQAYLETANLTASGSLTMDATCTSEIHATSVGIAASTWSGVGSGSANVITNLIESRITGGEVKLTGSGARVKLSALDTATIVADGGGFGVRH